MYKIFFPNIAAIILAGGKGTRMESELPKVLHTIANKPIIQHTLNILNQIGLGETFIVTGYKESQVKTALGEFLKYVPQKEQLGTGHATLQALPFVSQEINTILVLNGDDSAFYHPQTIVSIIKKHLKSKAKMSILTAIKEEVDVSGRVIRDSNGKILGIKANSKMTEEELQNNHELVCGLYFFDKKWLEENLPKVEISPKGEYNITGLIEFAIQEAVLQDIRLKNIDEWQSINTQAELEKARQLWKQLKG